MLDLNKLKDMPPDVRKHLKKMCKINLSQRSFYHYCKTLYPKVYTPDREYLKDMCTKLQLFYENKLINKKTGYPYMILIINMPPRFFKSFTISAFETWMFGKNPAKQAITACYNKVLSTKFARGVRDTITTPKRKGADLCFSDIFPNVSIKKGHSAVQEWSLDAESAHLSFLATSFGATLTGFGTNGVFVIDDQINDAADAMNETLLADNWYWFGNTMLSRVEGGAKIIINMTRWTDGDICGRILEDDLLKDETCVIKYEAMDLRTGKLLCEDIMNLRKYNMQKKVMDPSIFLANYHQRAIPNKGRMFKILKQYKMQDINANFSSPNADIRAVIDPTDGKNDFLCCYSYLVHDNQAYITSILHTQKAELQTPQHIASWLLQNGVKRFRIETNKNRQLALDIPIILKEKYHCNDIQMTEVYNTESKSTRIKGASWWVQNNVHFPEKWNINHKECYDHIYGYQEGGKNKFDDAPDALSEIKADVYNQLGASKPVFGFAIKRSQLSNEERYCYGAN